MSTPEPSAVGDTSPNIEQYSTATAVLSMLNSDIETLTTFKDDIEAAPVMAVFESIIVFLALVRVGIPWSLPIRPLTNPRHDQDGMKDGPFVELAEDCIRACHVLRSVTDPSGKQIEDLGRCVNPAQPSLRIITSDTRIVRHVESIVSRRDSCARDLHHPGSTEEWFSVWRMEMWEMLRVFNVRCFQFMVPTGV